MASSAAGAVIVSAAASCFLAAVFTRDALFTLGTFTAYWVFIFADAPYGSYATAVPLVKYQYTLMAVLLAVIAAVALVKLLGTGRLVNVWLTRLPLPVQVTTDDWNVPVFLVATAGVWLATFFTVLAVEGSLWGGNITMATGLAVTLAVVSALLALVMLILAAFQPRHVHGESAVTSDAPGLYYFFAFALAAGVPAVLWHMVSPGARGWAAGGVAFVLDLFILLGGACIEGQMGSSTDVRPYDGIHGGDGSYPITGTRIFFISLVHGLIFVIGGLTDVDSNSVATAKVLVGWTRLFALFATVAIVSAVIYSVIVWLFMNNVRRAGDLAHFSRGAPKGRTSPPTERLVKTAQSQPGRGGPRLRSPPSELRPLVFV